MKNKKKRPLPMPTEEEKMRARLKAASADPLVWAMKSVDDEFPDEREKNAETVRAEAAVEKSEQAEPVQDTCEPLDDEEMDEDILDDDEEEIDETETVESAAKAAEEPETLAREPVADAQSHEAKMVKGDGRNRNPEIEAEGKTTMPTGEGVVTMEVTPMRQDVSNVSPDKKKSEKKIAKAVKKSGDADKDNHRVQVKLMSLETKQKKMMMGLAALVLVAVGGVTFGIVATVKQSHTTQALEEQIANTVSKENDDIDGEYIYLRDWGLKVKIVMGLTELSYNYQNDDYAEVLIWGAKQDKSANYTPDFAKQTKNSGPLGTVVRVPRYERAAAGRLIWYDDYYNYYYQGPSGVPQVSEDEMSWWVESYLLIKDMLTNADNYVKIED